MALPQFARRAVLVAAICAAAGAAFPAHASSEPARPAEAPLAARIDGEPIYAFTVDTLWQQQRASKPALQRRAVLDDLILTRLLAARAKAVAPRTESAGLTVAFAPDVLVEERLVAALGEVYGKDIEAAMKALPHGSLESQVTVQVPLAQDKLDALFGKPGPLKLEIALSTAQEAQATAIEVLRYQFPGGQSRGITLYDVYHRQNVQGRLALSQQPARVAAQQARRILANAFVLHWAEGRFGADALADLRQAIEQGEAVMTMQQQYGVGLDTDAGSQLLNRLSAEATPEEIEKFYYQHKDQFARIDRVRARHIRLSDEAQAQRAMKALQGGASFAAVARSMSRAPDAAQGGDLGWISADGSKDWLASLALSQSPGKPSAAVRAPVGPKEAAYWEIVLVEEQVHGAHPLESETVRYQASRMIAVMKAMQQLGEIVEQARRAAKIEILEAK